MRFRGIISLLVSVFAGAVAAVASATDDLAARTVVLVNARQPDSVELGEFYATQRGIPRENIVALPMPEAETITWRDFIQQIWEPLQEELFKRKWLQGSASSQRDEIGRRRVTVHGHRMAFLVTVRGTPLRINNDAQIEALYPRRGNPQFETSRAAVDAELSLLAQPNVPVIGFMRNPLFNVRTAASVTEEFVVKVARLDGPSVADVRHMITSAREAERQGLIGRYYVDLKGPHAAGDRWLETTREQLNSLGFFGDVHANGGTFDIADRFDAPVLYFGWYAGTVNGPFLRPGFRFPPGAIALHIHSYSASSLRTTSDAWCGPLIARGVAATFGNVFEPYLELTIRPDLLLARLATGATLGEAAYFSTPVLGWQSVVLGDPLYRPFKVSLQDQVSDLAKLSAEAAGHVAARQAAVLDKLGMEKEARALLKRGMREFPSLALALALARYELLHERPKDAVAALNFLGVMKDISPTDWPLVRAGAEMIAQHGSAREALPVYRALVRATAPSRESQLRLLTEARKVADAVGDLVWSVELGRQIYELKPPPEPVKAGK